MSDEETNGATEEEESNLSAFLDVFFLSALLILRVENTFAVFRDDVIRI